MLPEGHRLTVLKHATKTSMSDELTLLMIVGADTPGNVSIVPAGTALTQPPALAEFLKPSELDFTALAKSLDLHSIPGVQEKISATMLTTPMSLAGNAYMLKLDPRDHPHLIVNEAAPLAAARFLKLPVVKSKLVHDAHQLGGLLVERFGRVYRAGVSGSKKLALDDATQVLNPPPSAKYLVTSEEVSEALARNGTLHSLPRGTSTFSFSSHGSVATVTYMERTYPCWLAKTDASRLHQFTMFRAL